MYSSDPYGVLVELLGTLVHLVLAGTFAVELVREVTEGFLGVQQPPAVVDVFQLHVRLVRVLLLEVGQGTRVTLAAARLVVVAVKPYTSKPPLRCSSAHLTGYDKNIWHQSIK